MFANTILPMSGKRMKTQQTLNRKESKNTKMQQIDPDPIVREIESHKVEQRHTCTADLHTHKTQTHLEKPQALVDCRPYLTGEETF